MTSEQKKLLAMLAGIEDQIRKRQYLNAHFRAFELAGDAWQEHIRANARMGSRQSGSPPGAVLDDGGADSTQA